MQRTLGSIIMPDGTSIFMEQCYTSSLCCRTMFIDWNLFKSGIHLQYKKHIRDHLCAAMNYLSCNYGDVVNIDALIFFLFLGQLYICTAGHPEESQGPGGAGQQDWWSVICPSSTLHLTPTLTKLFSSNIQLHTFPIIICLTNVKRLLLQLQLALQNLR